MNFLIRHFAISAVAGCLILAGLLYTVFFIWPSSRETETGIVLSSSAEKKYNEINISDDDKSKLLQYAYSRLDDYFGQSAETVIDEVPAIDGYEKLYITLLVKNDTRCSQRGHADRSDFQRTRLDIDDGIVRCIEDERFGGPLSEAELPKTKIVINIAYNRQEITGSLQALENNIELGLHSLEIVQGDRQAYFKESVPITSNYDHKKTLDQLCKKAGLKTGCYTEAATKVYKYDAYSFTGDRSGQAASLYRYNATLNIDEITPELINERIELAQAWFINNIDESTGLVHYSYLPSADIYIARENKTRELAGLWSMAASQKFLDNDRLNDIVKNTLDYYIDRVECRSDYCVVKFDGKTLLSYNAFVVLTLAEYTDYPDHKNWLDKLSRGLLAHQRADGSFRTEFTSDSDSGIDYYPGEAMLALMRAYKLTGEKNYLNAVGSAIPYYRAYWRGNNNTAFIPWHTQVNYLYYLETKNSSSADFVFEMNDWLIDLHQIKQSEFHDVLGAFPKSDPRYSTSAYLEGINDAYSLAVELGDREHQIRYKDSIKWATRFILLTQYTDQNTFYLPDPQRAIGGFRRSLINNEQRIDCTQHALLALIKAYNNSLFE